MTLYQTFTVKAFLSRLSFVWTYYFHVKPLDVTDSSLLWTPTTVILYMYNYRVAWVVWIQGKFDWGSLAFTLNFGDLCECRSFGTTVYVFYNMWRHGKYLSVLKVKKTWNHIHFVFFIDDWFVKLLLS